MAPAVANDGSAKDVRTTISGLNRRGRSGSAPYQADLAVENPTHQPIRMLKAHPTNLLHPQNSPCQGWSCATVSSRDTSLHWPSTVCLAVKSVGEPDAGNPHVRFDERGGETGRCLTAQATAPLLDSTPATFCPVLLYAQYSNAIWRRGEAYRPKNQ